MWLDTVTRYFNSLDPAWSYLVLFGASYVENIFPPLPGDSVVVFAAYLVGRSQRHVLGVLISTTLGSTAGFMTFYALGRLIHPEYLVRKNFRFLPAASLEAAGRWFERHGLWIVLFNRFFSVIRSAISLVCGIYRLPWPKVMLLSIVGAGLWNGLLIGASYSLGANWAAVEEILRQYRNALFGAAIVLLAAWLVRRSVFTRRKSN